MNSHTLPIKQLFYLMLLFQLGSIGVNFGGHIGKDAWISLILGTIEGMGLFILYYLLYKQHPSLTYTQILQHTLGKWIGTILSLLYSSYFIYIGARVVRDFTEILNLHILYQTPAWFISIFFLITVSYAGYKGLHTTSRVGMILLKMFLVLWLLFLIGVFLSHLFHLSNLQPLTPQNWRPIFKNILPLTIPYGGMITFLMLFVYTSQKDKIFKNGIWSIFISGFFLVATTILNIGILGGSIAQELSFPLLTSSSLIKIDAFIQRLEPIAIILLIIGVFFKVYIFHYTACLSISQVFKWKEIHIIPTISILMACISVFGAENNITHFYIGFHILPYYVHVPMQIIIPLIVLCIPLIYKRKSL
ncbi:spore gernimation protein KC [Bacillus thuringiensis]|uniref:GerAB/ArcD/ProY family transporter n=1 Tax=Bacillus thuringiensis TaxID=1428 RepID=UPI0018CED0F7|nr:endospore germination permease [Bacillus thuringiensis]MBG9517046.1 spore gernimation protein KC [Bacillus thuringiensis]